MDTFYSGQLLKINNSNNPLPSIKLRDGSGYSTTWMHLIPECIKAISEYINMATFANNEEPVEMLD